MCSEPTWLGAVGLPKNLANLLSLIRRGFNGRDGDLNEEVRPKTRGPACNNYRKAGLRSSDRALAPPIQLSFVIRFVQHPYQVLLGAVSRGAMRELVRMMRSSGVTCMAWHGKEGGLLNFGQPLFSTVLPARRQFSVRSRS